MSSLTPPGNGLTHPPGVSSLAARSGVFGPVAAGAVALLLVDDRADNLLALEGLLDQLTLEGVRLVRAASGRAALERVAAEEFAAVLLDVNMPGLDGFETARAIRERDAARRAVDPTAAPTPIIFLTAGDVDDRARVAKAFALGAVDFLGKPLDPDALRAKVAVFAELARTRHAAVAVAAERAALQAAAIEAEAARRAAEESEARYRLLAETVPALVWTARSDGRLDYVSDQTAAYVGAPASALLGDGWTAFLHRADVARTRARWGRSLATGEPYEIEFRIWSAAAREYRWHLVRAVPRRDGLGRVVGWVGVNADVEESKTTQAALDAARAAAEQAAEHARRLQREAEDARARAEEDRARADVANRAKSEFLSTMSHELRTPLNAIAGYVELLEMGLRGPVTDGQREDLARIRRSGQHLLALINDILNFARLDAGQVEFRIQDVRVDAALADLDALVAPQVATKGLTYTHAGCGAPGAVRADPERLRQILLNLLINAVKFTDAGGRIVIACDADERWLRLRVSDTGRGIPAEQIERIFEPFVQIDRNLTPGSQQGVGLGLAISRDLARRMGGDLTAESAPGHGSTFTLTLPRTGSGE